MRGKLFTTRGTEVRPERGFTLSERERRNNRSDQKIFAQTIYFFIIQNEKLHLPKVINNTAAIQIVYTNIQRVYIHS